MHLNHNFGQKVDAFPCFNSLPLPVVHGILRLIQGITNALYIWPDSYQAPTNRYQLNLFDLTPTEQVPVEPVCQDVPGPPVSCHQPGVQPAARRADLALHVR